MSDADRLVLSRETRVTFAEDQVLTPIQARSFVRSIQTSWQVATLQWTDGDSAETLSQAQRLVHAGMVLQGTEGGSAAEATLAFRRAGELFEWLARAGDAIGSTVPLSLFAAGAYQLGGLPAMATGILRQIPNRDLGLKLFASFLSADFDGALAQCAEFWRAHGNLTWRDAGATFFRDDGAEDMSWLASVEAGGFGLPRCGRRPRPLAGRRGLRTRDYG